MIYVKDFLALAMWLAPESLAGLALLAGGIVQELAGIHLVASPGDAGQESDAVDR